MKCFAGGDEEFILSLLAPVFLCVFFFFFFETEKLVRPKVLFSHIFFNLQAFLGGLFHAPSRGFDVYAVWGVGILRVCRWGTFKILGAKSCAFFFREEGEGGIEREGRLSPFLFPTKRGKKEITTRETILNQQLT